MPETESFKNIMKCDEEPIECDANTGADEYADYDMRTVFIFDEINGKMAKAVCRAMIKMAQMNPSAPITMFINSNGGSCVDGYSIIDTMRMVPCPVTTIITGNACSMASLISISGDLRYMTPSAIYMVHPLRCVVGGEINTINGRLKFIDVMNKQAHAIYAKQTKLPKSIIAEHLSKGELWMGASDALKYRCVDKVITAKLGGVPNMEKIEDMMKKRMDEIKKDEPKKPKPKKTAKKA